MIGLVMEVGYFAWVLFKHTWPVFVLVLIFGGHHG